MKKFASLIFVFVIFSLSGCLYKEDINSRAIVDVIAVDYTKEGYKLLFLPFSYEEKKPKLIESTGKTIDEALQNIKFSQNKSIFNLQANTLILSKNLLNDKFEEFLNNFNDTKKYNLNMNVYISNEIDKIMEKDDISKFFENKNSKIINSYENENEFFKVSLIDIFKKSNNKKSDLYIPNLKNEKDKVFVNSASFFNKFNYINDMDKNDIINFLILKSHLKNSYLTLKEKSLYINNIKVEDNNNNLKLSINYSSEIKDIENFKNILIESLNNTIQKLNLNKKIEDIIFLKKHANF